MINMGCLPWAGAYLRMPFRGKITTAIYQTTQRKNVDPGLIFCFRWAYQGYDANSERLMRKQYCLRGRDKWELGAPSRCLKWMHAYTVTSQLSGEWPVLWWCDICSSLTPGVSHRWCTEVLRTANRICIGYRVTAGAWMAAWHTYCSPPSWCQMTLSAWGWRVYASSWIQNDHAGPDVHLKVDSDEDKKWTFHRKTGQKAESAGLTSSFCS